jgi:polyvinyl alcohol dehydrogenase (cytochrome)
VVYALDPDRNGQLLWETRVGKGGPLGGVEFGMAADGQMAYVPVSDMTHGPDAGGIFGLRIENGEVVWHSPAPHVECRSEVALGCSGAQAAAATVIPGVVFSGAVNGHMRAYSTADGAILWDFDTNREFTTVNGVPAKGASINGPGPVVGGGSLLMTSGYSFLGRAGNVLLAFGVD